MIAALSFFAFLAPASIIAFLAVVRAHRRYVDARLQVGDAD